MPSIMTKTLVAFSWLAVGSASLAAAPDLTGPWEIAAPVKLLKTAEGKAPPLTAAGLKLYAKNQAKPDSDPAKVCLPLGIPRALMQSGFPFSIVIGASLGGMMIEWNHLPRVLYMNQKHFENIGPEYLGQSIAHWDGTTLVIDTNGYNDITWLDESGLPHSDALHTVERLRLQDTDTLLDTISFEDAAVFRQRWQTTLSFRRKPGVVVKEDYCLGRLGLGVTVSK
jgi:hypothetical protein